MNKKTVCQYSLTTFTACVVALFFCLFILSLKVDAATLSEEYSTGTAEGLVSGSIVSIDRDNPQNVSLASSLNSNYWMGVVQDSERSLVNFQSGDEANNISVAFSGEVIGFVSDESGVPVAGDFLTVSSVPGVAMKATTLDTQRLIGVVLSDFSTNDAREVSLSNDKKLSIGKIRFRLLDGESDTSRGKNQENVTALENAIYKLVGKKVSYSRIIGAIVLFVVTIAISGFLLANAVRASFISIGRNPLSSTFIFSAMLQTSGLGVLVILIGAGVAYVVLAF